MRGSFFTPSHWTWGTFTDRLKFMSPKPEFSKGKKILVVDDEPELVSLIAAFLGDAGYEIITAGDGEKALEMVQTNLPDLILMDIMLPKMDGWLVCQKLKADEKLKKIPTILLSGMLVADSTPDKSVEKCDYLLAKPIEMQNLLQKVQEFIAVSH